MSSQHKILVPYITNALALVPNYQDNVDNIILQVEKDLKANNQTVENVAEAVKQTLQLAEDFGLLSSSDGMFRLNTVPYRANDEINDEDQSVNEENNGGSNEQNEEVNEIESSQTLEDDDDSEEESNDKVSNDLRVKAESCPSGFCQYRRGMKRSSSARRARSRPHKSKSRTRSRSKRRRSRRRQSKRRPLRTR